MSGVDLPVLARQSQPVGPQVPDRGKRPRNRRDIILAVASELFAIKGFSDVSIEEIATAVNVRPSALYRHFSGKQELLREAISVGARRRTAAVDSDAGLLQSLEDLASSAIQTRRASALWTLEVRNLDDEDRKRLRRELREVPERLGASLVRWRPDFELENGTLVAWAALDVLASIAFHEITIPDDDLHRALRDAMVRVVTMDPPCGEPPPVPVKLRRGVRREAVLDTAAALFSRQGFHRVTIEEIARTAGLSTAGLYGYFASKQGLLATLLVRATEWQEAEVRRSLAGRDTEPRGRLQAILAARIRFTYDEPELATLVLSDLQHAPEEVRDALGSAAQEGIGQLVDLVCELDPGRGRTLARVQVWAALMVIHDVLTTPTLRRSPGLQDFVGNACLRVLDIDTSGQLPTSC